MMIGVIGIICLLFVAITSSFWVVDGSWWGGSLDWVNMLAMTRLTMGGFAAVLVSMMWVANRYIAFFAAHFILLSMSRSAFIGAMVGIGVYGILVWVKKGIKWKRLKIPILVLLLICGAAAVSPLGTKFNKINWSSLGAGSRSQWIAQSHTLIQEMPWWGYGVDTLVYYLKPAAGPTVHVGAMVDRTHNIALDVLLQTGWVGYFLCLAILSLAIHKVLKSPTSMNLTCFCGLTTWITIGFFNPQGIPAHFLMVLCLFGLGRNNDDENIS